jgi:hypothetical protein
LDPEGKQTLFSAFSEPIKVISKSDQVKKKKPPRKKRNISEIITDSLYDIEIKQEEQMELLERLKEQNEVLMRERVHLLAKLQESAYAGSNNNNNNTNNTKGKKGTIVELF